jgi:hypothetical protein
VSLGLNVQFGYTPEELAAFIASTVTKPFPVNFVPQKKINFKTIFCTAYASAYEYL